MSQVHTSQQSKTFVFINLTQISQQNSWKNIHHSMSFTLFYDFNFISLPQDSCGKVIFSQASVCSQGVGNITRIMGYVAW